MQGKEKDGKQVQMKCNRNDPLIYNTYANGTKKILNIELKTLQIHEQNVDLVIDPIGCNGPKDPTRVM